MRRGVGWIVAAMVVGMGVGLAGAESGGTTTADSAAFARVKRLAGRWEGTTRHSEGAEEPAAVEYKLTSGGSAVVETLFPGTPHEMVSVYHDVAGQLAMTHYCLLHNQPQLQLIGADDRHLELSLTDSPGIDASKDQHMHALTLTWQDSDHLTQTWTSYEGGKPHETTTIRLSRRNVE